jgi:DNA-binding Xre family transcriptional regulator
VPRLRAHQPTRDRVAHNLDRLLRDRNVTPVQLAAAARVTRSVIYRVKNADTGVTIDVLGRLALALKCDVAEFFRR